MTASYRYVQRYRPRVETRIPDAVSFLQIASVAMGIHELCDDSGHAIRVSEEALALVCAKRSMTVQYPETGVDFDLFSGTGLDDEVSRFEFHVGTSPGEVFVDVFSVQFASAATVINHTAMAQLVAIGRPIEAFLAENNNEFELGAKRRQNRIQAFSRPALIRGLHFIGQEQIEALGGWDKCRRAPVYRAEACATGVLLQLVEQPFDQGSLEHVRRQAEAMEFFGV